MKKMVLFFLVLLPFMLAFRDSFKEDPRKAEIKKICTFRQNDVLLNQSKKNNKNNKKFKKRNNNQFKNSCSEHPEKCYILYYAKKYKITYKLAADIYQVAKQEKIPVNIFFALIYTESSFRPYCRTGHYYGLTQIPYNVPIHENLIIGARILKEKLKIAHGNMLLALMYYKGFHVGDPRGIYLAEKVLRLARS